MLHDPAETPAAAGFAMPPEWSPHAACLMAWPTRRELWLERLDDAKADYAGVARTIAAFEPLVMLCNPGDEQEVRDLCGAVVEPLPIPLDDSWVRDNGPIFVRDTAGQVAVVSFGFNAWGGRWYPHDNDAALPERVATHLGMRVFTAPFVLEGGAFLVDGEGTLITTEQCLLNPNRNPRMDRGQIEQGLRDYLGVSTVVWLKSGHSTDVGPAGTDGHLDGVAAFVAPGHVMLEAPHDPTDAEYAGGQANLAALNAARDARGRALAVSQLDPGPGAGVSYSNFYIANGAIVVAVGGDDNDGPALEFIAELYPGHEVIGVPGLAIAYGGGGVHCITQQIPAGEPAVVQV
jgi:agmatine deiminase